jgi:hypothetical protein
MRLLAKAEHAAGSIAGDDHLKWSQLSWVATGLATVAPDQAQRVGRAIGEPGWAANALAKIAIVLAATAAEADRAEALLYDAEHLAETSQDRSLRTQARTWVAAAKADAVTVMAAGAPLRAERVARSIAGEAPRPRALAAVAVAMTAVDAARAGQLLAEAEGVASSLADPDSKVTALTDIARVLIA